MAEQCFFPIFFDVGTECRFLLFNGDFWLNSVTELLVGGGAIFLIVWFFHGRQVRSQWRAMRKSRAAFLVRDMRAMVTELDSVILGFSNYSRSGREMTRQFFYNSVFSANQRLGFIRAWLTSSTIIFPTQRLPALAAMETLFLTLDNKIDVFLDNAEFFVRLMAEEKFNNEKRDFFINEALSICATLEEFRLLMDSSFSHLGEPTTRELNILIDELEGLRRDTLAREASIAVAEDKASPGAGEMNEFSSEAAIGARPARRQRGSRISGDAIALLQMKLSRESQLRGTPSP